MPVPLKSSQKEVQYLDRIEGWLEKLEIQGLDTDKSGGDEIIQDETRVLAPTTPTQRINPRPILQDKVSPTDTTFSRHSIFDVPLRRNLFGSPVPKCEISEDDSDNTSIDSDTWVPLPKNERLGPPNFSLLPSVSSVSLDSHDSTSDVHTGEPIAVSGRDVKPSPPPQDPNEPRPVWITSCLQCTLAGLPCSRTYPHCSRCKRNNRAEDCLLQRRCFASEVLGSSLMDRCKAPTLLKVKGEDEEIRKRKIELAEDLYEKWIAEQEKMNWVVPDIDSPRGGWRACKNIIKKEKISHPGEGIGRLSFGELFIDVDA